MVTQHRRQGRSPAADARPGTSRASPGRWRPGSASGRGRHGDPGCTRRNAGSNAVATDLQRAPRPLRRPRRRPAAPGGPPAGPRPKRHLGNVGQTVMHTEPIEAQPVAARPRASSRCRELVEDMDRGQRRGAADPGRQSGFHGAGRFRVRTRPCSKVPLRAHLSLYQDETSRQCHWHLPEAHYLEAWSDTRSVRRHRLDRAAADRAALPGPLRS